LLKKRVIFTLLYDNGSFMLSRNFRLQKVGNLNWLKKNYNFSKIAFSIDELIILDVTRGNRDEKKFQKHIYSLTEECFVPIAAGGGIRTLEQAQNLLHSGSDKVVVNTLIYKNPQVIRKIAEEFGRQSVVATVDAKKNGDNYSVWIDNGTVELEINLEQWLNEISNLPIGEVYLNSMDRDGTGQGYELELLSSIPKSFPIPVILAGGAGKYKHLAEGLLDNRVDAVATANLFNFIGDGLQKARDFLREQEISLAAWNIKRATELSGFFTNKKANACQIKLTKNRE